jgi:uncharacterized protein involved in exopolysaccharide biosynthesis
VSRYLETFSRHKILFVLPVVLALFMSVWYSSSAPKKYETGMTVWFDTAVPNASSVTNPSPYSTPAGDGQAEMQQFFGTDQFLLAVGHDSTLAKFLATYHPAKKGPSALISKLKGLVKHSSSGSAPASAAVVDGEILSTLGKAFTATAAGPQIVKVTMTSSDPSYMQSALAAVATEYQNEVSGSLKSRDKSEVSYYQNQLTTAQQSLASANSAVATYLAAHPGVTVDSSLQYSQLVQIATQAQNSYSNMQSQLQQAQDTLQNVQAPAAFHVVDAAGPAYAISGKKHMIFTVIAGLFVGVLISILALSTLTALDKTARRQEDIDGLLGLEVVATIRQLPRQRRLPALGKAKSS